MTMSESCHHSNPLKHLGTSQGERMPAALDPDHVELHGLNESNWLEFAYHYSQLINYFQDDDPDQPKGDWQNFFTSENEISALLKQYGNGEVEPHMALFISFLKLLTHSQKSLNELPKRHLDFYYKQVLQLKKKPFQPDSVHVLFELAAKAGNELVDENVDLNAGKDSDGNALIYKTTTPLVVNHANIVSLKSVCVEKKDDDIEILRHAPVANSLDGIGEEPEEGQHWQAFGNNEWPEAEFGFYIASDLLLMKEGSRRISLKFKLLNELTIQPANIDVFVTAEDDWMEITSVKSDAKNSPYNFILDLEIAAGADPVTAYHEKIHESNLLTEKPVLKIIFTRAADYHNVKNAEIDELNLEVEVTGAASIELKNELGNIDPEKPFMPFGSRPKIGSKLSVNYPEMAGKPVSKIELEMQWLNTPANFSMHYSHYEDAIKKQKDALLNNFVNMGNYSVMLNYKGEIELQQEYQFIQGIIFHALVESGPPPDTMKQTFKARVESPYNSSATEFELFSSLPQATVNATGSTKKVADSKLSMILTESFYHDLYSKLYVNAVLTARRYSEADLPNEPYTPLLDNLTLNYTAHENVSFSAVTESNSSSVMFHKHPFGTRQVAGETNSLVPVYDENELYIGLGDMDPGGNISLLFQVAEGSENPQLSSFDDDDIDWSVLSDNNWIKLGKDNFVRDQTNNFLRSGIVELAIPKHAGSDNTLLQNGLHWLRIRLKKDADAVSRFIQIHAQAAEAEFQNRNNSTSHLNNGLPAESIGKLVNPRASIKTVTQPYSGFGGEPEETDSSFYRRVSERLRHKNRAITIWDYEHLVLEEFPSLYKVKCLNHSYWNGTGLDEMSPGNVTLVLIPKLTEDNTKFRLKPMVSRDFIDRVEAFINGQNSIQANVQAVNPVYEPVRFEFGVEFRQGLDFNYHKKRVMDDLKQLMAPWVFETDAAIEFGGSFSEYQVVHFLENLSYVDYISDFRMFHKPLNSSYSQKATAEPSIPMAILIPVFDEDKINPTEECNV